MESWPSGRRRTPGKCVGSKRVSRVRIPNSPPLLAEALTNVKCFGECFSDSKFASAQRRKFKQMSSASG